MTLEELNIAKADDLKAYNYIILTDSGNIKIGLSSDPINRMKSLSNSNSGGFKIIDVCVSPQRHITDTVEKYLHWYYRNNRVEGEWFSNLNYEEVKSFFNSIFIRRDFITANSVRQQFEEEHGMKLSEWKATHGLGRSPNSSDEK